MTNLLFPGMLRLTYCGATTGRRVRAVTGALRTRNLSTSSDDSPVTVEQRGRIALVRLNRPKSLNAMTAEIGDAFAATVRDLSERVDEIGAVVITGEGKAFSAGGDLDFLTERHHDQPHRNAHVMRRFYQRFLCVRDLPVPVIAAINGPAVGAGLCFALACDLRVAAPTARMGVTFVGLGLHPGMGCTHFLPQIVGPQVSARMLLTGELITAQQALSEGLVALIADDSVAAAEELANKMAAQAPIAVRTALRTLRTQQDAGLEAALWREADAQAQCYADADLLDGVNALREKRKPSFTAYDNLQD